MKEIILVGAGGHCKSCIDVIEKQKKFKIIGIIDNKKKGYFLKYKILGKDDCLKKYYKKKSYILITVGQIKSSKLRESIYTNLISQRITLPVII